MSQNEIPRGTFNNILHGRNVPFLEDFKPIYSVLGYLKTATHEAERTLTMFNTHHKIHIPSTYIQMTLINLHVHKSVIFDNVYISLLRDQDTFHLPSVTMQRINYFS